MGRETGLSLERVVSGCNVKKNFFFKLFLKVLQRAYYLENSMNKIMKIPYYTAKYNSLET